MAAPENITVLFTDLVGSTKLASALTPEAGDEVRRRHFSALRQAIAASGGTEVKTLGDGLMVVFPAASTALACAVAMQQAVDRDNSAAERPLGLRVGLSAGEATREEDDYFGDPVIEAARLCARAESGQILTADLVRANAGRRNPFAFTSLGELELKGLLEPVETLEVLWEPLDELEAEATFVPLPARLEIVPLTGVVARDGEAGLLTDAYKRVAEGEGREVVLVSGEPGLGKTTLVTEAARRGFSAGACVLLGRCEEDLSASYAPLAEALHHYVANAPEEVLRAHIAAHGGELARMVPALGRRLGTLPSPTSTDPDTERYLLYGAVVGLLTVAATRQPVVLVIDDLQWSDKPSLQLLRHLVANVHGERLLVLVTFRDSGLSGSHPLTEILGALRREPKVSRIDLKGFDDTGVLTYMEAAAGQHLDDEGVRLAHALYHETDGNPFFVGIVLLNLIETGTIYQDESGRWVAVRDLSEIALPRSVREVISARVARLGERAGRVLTLAAVIGRDFDINLLDALTGLGEDELLDILDAASAAALVREDSDVAGRWSFSHALTQHTLYQDLGATRRARVHRQVAEALEALYGEHTSVRVGELAHHWSNATQPVDAAKAMSYARRAAEAALSALAPDDAVRYFSQALEFFGQRADADPLLGVDLLLGLGEAQRQTGIAAFRESFLEAAHRAQELGAKGRLVSAALGNNRGYFSAGGVVDADRVAVLKTALHALTDSDSPERALLLATLCSELSFGPFEQRRALADEAKAMARRLGDTATLLRVLNLVCDPLQVPSTLAERMADTIEALALAEALGDPEPLFWAASFGRINAVQSGDFDLGERCMSTMQAVANRLRQPTMIWTAMFHESGRALLAGNPEQAEQLATVALEIGTESGQPDAFTFYGAGMMSVRRQQGRLEELVSLIEEMAVENPGLPLISATLALARLEAGDEANSLTLLEEASVDGFASLPLDIAWMIGVTRWADVAIELYASGPAQKLSALLDPYHEQIPYIAATGSHPVAFYLGGLSSAQGRYDQAEAYFAEASELNTRFRMKHSEASTDLEWGRMLAVRSGSGDREHACRLLEQAMDAASRHGYASLERRASAELTRLA